MADQRPAPIFVADSPGLDFLNSFTAPAGAQVEWIGSGSDLISWLLQTGLLPPDAIVGLRKKAELGEFDAVAAQARKLREWFRAFVRTHKGKPLGSKVLRELEPLNQILVKDEEIGQIIARGNAPQERRNKSAASGLVWCTRRSWRSPDALLFPIARAMAQLVCEEDFRHVKVCEGPHCTLFFMDRTRGQARRWCSMSVCGNRAKQAAHRQRILHRRA